jgi:hypothetical protein
LNIGEVAPTGSGLAPAVIVRRRLREFVLLGFVLI